MRDPRAEPRALALDALLGVEGGAFLDSLVGEALTRHALEPRDAALFTRLAYGTAAWQGRLDWTLAALLKHSLERLDPPLRAALRLGLYQIQRLDRIPAHAAVDRTVRAVRRHTGRGGAGLVNAVLRRAAREGERALPAYEQDPVARLAIEWSHPEWLVRRWLAELGETRTVRRLAANNEAAPTVLRVDLRSTTRDGALAQLATRGLDVRATRYASSGIVLEGPLAAVAQCHGLSVQSEASQLVVGLLAAAPGERILDACAAPGGKALASAERLGDTGAIVAADRSRTGVRGIRQNRVADHTLLPAIADAARPPWRDRSFDAAIVDAPCSGLGTLRSHPEIRWRRRVEDLARHSALQRTILAATASCVRSGGRLVYATCTLAAEENEEVVDAFLQGHPDWYRADAALYLPPAAASLVDSGGDLRTHPEEHGLDGFYAARLQRR